MRVELVRHGGGKHTLRCRRDDNSITWQTRDKHGEFFAYHDLTHFAIESVCGYRNGFFGLVAQGWDIEDTTGKGKRGPLPPGASEVEQLVGLFDMQRASLREWTSEEFAEAGSPRTWDSDELAGVYRLRSELFSRWAATSDPGSLELFFPPAI